MTEQQALGWRVPVARLRTHNAIVDRLGLSAGDVLLDAGCGNGFTMATAATRVPGISLIGVDVDEVALAAAASWLDEIGVRHQLLHADAGARLPLPDASVTHVVCHDVLENLEDPGGLMGEAYRVLVPGGVSVWSHVDYDSVVVGGADRALTRRMVQAYGEASREGMDRSDAQMGRKVAALVARSPLVRTDVDAHVLIATDLDGPGQRRIDDIASTLRRSVGFGEVDVGLEEIEHWVGQLRRADESGQFFYSQTAYMVTARKQ